MLRTNSKKAIENIRAYILDDMDYIEERADYDGLDLDRENVDAVLSYVREIFIDEKGSYEGDTLRAFTSWAQGLAMSGLFCYYYNRSAVADLGDILEETEEQRSRYSEEEAAALLTKLIYREIEEAARRESKKASK